MNSADFEAAQIALRSATPWRLSGTKLVTSEVTAGKLRRAGVEVVGWPGAPDDYVIVCPAAMHPETAVASWRLKEEREAGRGRSR